MAEEETSHQLFQKVEDQIEIDGKDTQRVLEFEQESTNEKNQELAKEISNMVTDPRLFITIEEDMREVEKNFSSDPVLEAFKVRFETLFVAMKNSRENETTLIRRCTQTKFDIELTHQKIASANTMIRGFLKDSEDKKSEVKNTWSMAEEVNLSMKELEEKIEKTKESKKEVELKIDQASQNAELQKQQKKKEKLFEKEEKIKILNTKEHELRELKQYNDNLAFENGKLEDENAKLLKNNENLKNDHQEVMNNIDQKENTIIAINQQKIELEDNIVRAKEELKSFEEKIEQNKQTADQENKRWSEMNKMKDDNKKKILTEENKIKAYQKEIEKLKMGVESSKVQTQELSEEIKYEKRRIASCDKEIQKLLAEQNSMRNLKLDLENQMTQLQMEKEDLEIKVKAEAEALERYQKDYAQKENDEQDQLKQLSKMEQMIKEQKNGIYKTDLECHQLESRAKKLENQNKGYEIESVKLNSMIRELQKQQEKYGAEASTAHARFFQTVEELKIKNSIIDELQKKNSDLENKLKHQQNLYEAVRSDRNLYSKNLREAQEETEALTKKFMVMTHQINQLKEEIKRKDESIMKELLKMSNAEKQKKATLVKSKEIGKHIGETKDFIKNHEIEIGKLKYVIGEAQGEKQKQMKDYEMVLNERDILGGQLIKRKQELDQLYEKIKISESNLAKGENCFKDKQNLLTELKKKLIELRQEYKDSEAKIFGIGHFKSEINSLEKEILKEQTKNRALADELLFPMNVHRWKKMEATDPENFERIMKIQTLQRRVITKTEEVQAKDKLIKEKEQLFLQLKNVLSRQPGPEVFSQIEIYEGSLKEKMGQFKKMLKELKDAQSRAKAYKYEINMVNEQISKIKQDYFKKRDTEEKAKLKNMQQSKENEAALNRQAYYQSLGIKPTESLAIGASPQPQPPQV